MVQREPPPSGPHHIITHVSKPLNFRQDIRIPSFTRSRPALNLQQNGQFCLPRSNIPRFFEEAPLSHAECDQLFIDTIVSDFPSWRFDNDASPIDSNAITFEPGADSYQGCFSYTAVIISGSRRIVAQFRKNTDRVPVGVVEQALVSYQGWIPPTIVYDEKDWQLFFAPYAGASFARQAPEYSPEHEIRSMKSFARFIAAGCSTTKPSSLDIINQIRSKLSMWVTWNLDQKFSSVIRALLSSLGSSWIVMCLINQRTC